MFGKYGVPIDTVVGRGTAIQPKLSFKFRVRLISFGGLEKSAPRGLDITQQVVSIQKPTISFPKVDVYTYGGPYKTFNQPVFNAVRLTLRDDIENGVLFAINSQLQKQYDLARGRHAISSGTAKFTLLIETLDGQNEIRSVDTWRLDGCFISDIDYGENNYSSGESSIISMSIEFDHINDHYSESEGALDAVSSLFYVTSKSSEVV